MDIFAKLQDIYKSEWVQTVIMDDGYATIICTPSATIEDIKKVNIQTLMAFRKKIIFVKRGLNRGSLNRP